MSEKIIPPYLQPIRRMRVASPPQGLRIAVIPDGQVHEGVPINHWKWVGQYLAIKKPDVIINLGDFTDFPSISSHNSRGSLQLEGARYKKDVDSSKRAMGLFINEIGKVSGYDPEMFMTLGNHEHRVIRLVEEDPKLEGIISLNDLKYEEAGWKVFPFLQPIVVGGIAFCHYFPSGIMGRPITTARALLSKLHMSAIAGHQQGRDIAYGKRADGVEMTAIISGSFYQHAEEYLSPFTNNHWRGFYVLNEAKEGSFDEVAISIKYLLRRYT